MAEPIITLEDRTPSWSTQTVLFVSVDGINRGIISQFKPETAPEPWKAFRMGCLGSMKPIHNFGTFDSQQEAIDAVVSATRNQPKHIVFPEPDPNVGDNWARLGIQHN